jgi:hypothetical protein
MITEKMVTIEKPRSLDASGDSLPPLSDAAQLRAGVHKAR